MCNENLWPLSKSVDGDFVPGVGGVSTVVASFGLFLALGVALIVLFRI